MPDKVTDAIQRLNGILPLKRNQSRLDDSVKQLYLEILRSYVEIGRSLNRQEIALRTADPDNAIQLLQQYDMVVFDEQGEPVGAYPFTMEQREYRLFVNGHQVHCMCALDSLAVSPMFDMEVRIASVCEVTGSTVSILQNGFEIINADEVADVYFGINWNAAASDNTCAASLCTEMFFLKGKAVASDWKNLDHLNRQIFDLSESVRFAAGFFMPLLA